MKSKEYAQTLKHLKELIYDQNALIRKSIEDLEELGFIVDLDNVIKKLYVSNGAIRRSVIALDMYASVDSAESLGYDGFDDLK